MRDLPTSVWLLTLIQALAMSVGAMMVLIGGVIGAEFAPSSSLATLPVAGMIVGTATGVFPITRLMGRLQRRPVFIGVSLLTAVAALCASVAVYLQDFWLFVLASFVIGLAVAGFQQIRFAAIEAVDVEKAPKAASNVLLGGLAAAILGPELVTFGKDLFAQQYVGTFVLMALVSVLCALLFMGYKAPAVHGESEHPHATDIGDVLKSPLFIVAVSASVVGYALMSFIMTATPVHMHVMEHHSLEHTKWVIQSHILAMFLPSFISGWLIARFGVYRVIALGLFAYVLTIAMALSGNALLNYWSALVLLGVGWNFLFLGGTVLLPQTYREPQKFKVQGMHELMVFSAQGAAALGAGVMLFVLGWQGLMISSFAIIVLHVLLLLWQWQRNRQREDVIEEST